MSLIRRVIRIPFHPFFVGMYPAVSFLAHNRQEVQLVDSARVCLVVLLGTVLLFLLLRFLMRDVLRAAMVASSILILFFSYGHVYQFLRQTTVLGVDLGRHRILLFLYLAMSLFTIRWLIKRRDLASMVTRFNLISIALLSAPMFQVLTYPWVYRSEDLSPEVFKTTGIELDKPNHPPDVYYIIPDSYTRDDVMLEFYGYDNSAFLDALEDRGFIIARCSRSNYQHTHLSLGSSLNLDYIPQIFPREGVDNLRTLVRENVVRRSLENIGYTTIAFDTGYPHTAWDDASVYFSIEKDPFWDSLTYPGLTEYETAFLRTTAGLVFLDADSILDFGLFKFVEVTPLLRRYDRIAFTLDQMMNTPSISGPKFVFGHIMLPHDPYIFSQSGDFISIQEDYKAGYRNQVSYTNSRLLAFVDMVIAESEGQAIIIIQGDHGAPETLHRSTRLPILNAYYLPGAGSQRLYPSVTPVNTFRIIFDTYFGTDLGLLPDASYLSSTTNLYEFIRVPETREGCE